MEIRKKFVLIISILFIILSFSLSSYAGWTGPTTIVAGTWGTGTTQFGLEKGDTSDDFPQSFGISDNGRIIIADSINERLDVFNSDGSYMCSAKSPLQWDGWPASVLVNGSNCAVVGYVEMTHTFSVNDCSQIGFAKNMGGANYVSQDCSKIYVNAINGWKIYTPTGTLLTTTSSRPMELGILSQKITGTSHYKRIEYPDGVYFYYYTGSTGYFKYESELFRVNSNLILDNQGSTVYAFTATAISTPAGQKQQYQLLLNATWNVPQNQYKVIRPADNNFGLEEKDSIIAEYGEAVIGPDGSIYTWVRSDTDYKILKWTWSP